jgi:hypothetical protein
MRFATPGLLGAATLRCELLKGSQDFEPLFKTILALSSPLSFS